MVESNYIYPLEPRVEYILQTRAGNVCISIRDLPFAIYVRSMESGDPLFLDFLCNNLIKTINYESLLVGAFRSRKSNMAMKEEHTTATREFWIV